MTQFLFKLLTELNPKCSICNKSAFKGFKVKPDKDEKAEWAKICSKKCLSEYLEKFKERKDKK